MISNLFKSVDILTTFEWLIVSLVICAQVYYTIKAKSQIKSYQELMPDSDSFGIKHIKVSEDTINGSDIHALHQSLLDNSYTGVPVEQEYHNHVDLTLLNYKPLMVSKLYRDKIAFTINHYIIRSRNKALDFSLIQDIVERQVQTFEDQIRPLISLPLYLGLMTTMIGIIMGLFSMPDLTTSMSGNFSQNDKILNHGITALIGGVKVAMIASLMGLALTTYLSTFTFRKAHRIVENNKDTFYAFIQIELLPVINQSLPSTISSLQDNLLKFNDSFKSNLDRLSDVFGKNTEAIKAQKELLDALDRDKIAAITNYNIQAMKKLEESTQKIDQLNLYFDKLNNILNNTQNLISVTDAVLRRTSAVGELVDNIKTITNDNKVVMDFIYNDIEHIRNLRSDTRAQLSVYNQDITDSFDNLLNHIKETTKSIKQFTSDEYHAIEEALSGDRDFFRQLDEISSINNKISELVSSQQQARQNDHQALSSYLKKVDGYQQSLLNVFNDQAKSIAKMQENTYAVLNEQKQLLLAQQIENEQMNQSLNDKLDKIIDLGSETKSLKAEINNQSDSLIESRHGADVELGDIKQNMEPLSIVDKDIDVMRFTDDGNKYSRPPHSMADEHGYKSSDSIEDSINPALTKQANTKKKKITSKKDEPWYKFW